MDAISRSRTALLPTTYREPAEQPQRSTPKPRVLERSINTVDAFTPHTPTHKALVDQVRRTTTPTAISIRPPTEGLTKSAESEPRVSAQGFFSSVGDALKDFGGRVVDGVAGIGKGIYDSVKGTLKNTWEMAETFGKGIANIFTGRFAEGFTQLGLSVLKAIQTPTDGLLRLGGSILSAIQTMLFIEPTSRKLTGDELAALHEVYGDSIDYTRIEIKEGNAGLLTVGGRPFTHGDTIYIPKDSLPLQPELLVHEAAHVWQHQHGGNDYMSEALVAQLFGDGYNVGKALRQGKSWEQMNPEQQAEFIELAFGQGCFETPPAPFELGGKDYTQQLEAAKKSLRAGQGAP
ncbi:hypothetical protein [Corallococcus carmarthensis]|uniref:DUF4157 domain-containing protein n=1 Tax=Corallococcus carmarthensis TaxID=2316728 RepID=A0A3A8KBZ4_9BACT|nr:hypothetical protein [Corallococcus carmarthensis]RKH05046.1 hypothetical protein D7X32_09000 [Corallococcus carmarthensis]